MANISNFSGYLIFPKADLEKVKVLIGITSKWGYSINADIEDDMPSYTQQARVGSDVKEDYCAADMYGEGRWCASETIKILGDLLYPKEMPEDGVITWEWTDSLEGNKGELGGVKPADVFDGVELIFQYSDWEPGNLINAVGEMTVVFKNGETAFIENYYEELPYDAENIEDNLGRQMVDGTKRGWEILLEEIEVIERTEGEEALEKYILGEGYLDKSLKELKDYAEGKTPEEMASGDDNPLKDFRPEEFEVTEAD